MILDYHSDPFILSHVFDFTELLLAYACPSGILQRKIDARPINANDGSKMAGCNKSKTHVIRRPKRIFCLDAFKPPGSGPQQRKTCCKANTHFKNIWWNIIVTIKMYIPVCATSNLFKLVPTWTTTKKNRAPPLAQHHTAFKRFVPAGQGYSNGFLILQVLKFNRRAGSTFSTFCRGTFHLQLQTTAAQNMLQNQRAPEANWTNKNHTSPLAQHHNTFPKQKRSSGPRLIKRVPDFTGSAIHVLCRFHILQRHLHPPSSRLQQPKTCCKANMHLN